MLRTLTSILSQRERKNSIRLALMTRESASALRRLKPAKKNIIDADPSAEALATFKRPLRGRKQSAGQSTPREMLARDPAGRRIPKLAARGKA
jgi:hypothetical protein